MLRLRGRVVQLSSVDWGGAAGQLSTRRAAPAVSCVSSRRQYASASSESVERKPIKKLLVANRGYTVVVSRLARLVNCKLGFSRTGSTVGLHRASKVCNLDVQD